jgi:hypothetical protein
MECMGGSKRKGRVKDMEFRELVYSEVLSVIPYRLIKKIISWNIGLVFYKAQDERSTVVIAQVGGHGELGHSIYCGVATKSAQDKFDAKLGFKIAVIRCLRSAGILPEAKERKQRNRRITRNPFGVLESTARGVRSWASGIGKYKG